VEGRGIRSLALAATIAILLGGLPVGAAANEVDRAVTRGVAYLIAKQQPSGAIIEAQEQKQEHPHALTGLAALALVAVGHRPTDATPEGKALRGAIEFLLDEQRFAKEAGQMPGYFGVRDGSRMYGHGIVTLLLAELIGMGLDAQQDALIRVRCQAAVDLIVRSQRVEKPASFKGGWRYAPLSADADLSVTVWQVLALRAAQNAGMKVPAETIAEAVRYIKRSYAATGDAPGGFAYQPGGAARYATAAAGLLALQVCGEYEAPELTGAAEWLRQQRPKSPGKISHFYYGTYYYSQGMYQRGGVNAADARQYVESILVAEQKPDGRWVGTGAEANPVYCTALAVLSLSVRHHFMPIYQR
jgi:hypothetical protein